jgi:exoribonuclease R
MISTLILNGRFYCIDGYKSCRFIKNDLFYLVIPNDTIEYSINNSLFEITKIIDRKEITSVGIFYDDCYLYFPLISEYYKPKYIGKKGDRVLCKISLNGIEIIKYCKDDYDLIKDLYYSDFNNFNDIYDYMIKSSTRNNNLYTKTDRIDLTELNTFTIDPELSKDFDDAISINLLSKTIYIHIVDINELIEFGSDIDKQSAKLSFSLYTPEGVENILPSQLAENDFSLIKNEIRKVITIEFSLNSNYEIINYEIYRSVIKVKSRYSYENVDMNEEINYGLIVAEKWNINKINSNFNIQLNFEKPDKFTIINKNNTKINKFIEAMMIKTNETISKHLNLKHQRHHPSINEDKNKIKDEFISDIITIKRYKSAKYKDINGHYGLKLQQYTHFTSPLRRYFDTLVHRSLAGYDIYMDQIVNHLNERERKIKMLIKLYNDWKIMNMIKIGDIYEGVVIKKNNNGILILLKEIMKDVFIENNSFEIGSKLMLIISKIDIIKNKIEVTIK